ncbi:transmembrane protease serine 9-like [Neodiprion virginianus]|uniref:transmembrane protease serine 9-like n=1 Tax=Neodiprion virginianus TaxID=2961670 RepID=UPI001EE70DCE|nr:transmembrane protease serine 9-like [Neodiprion virginianus]
MRQRRLEFSLATAGCLFFALLCRADTDYLEDDSVVVEAAQDGDLHTRLSRALPWERDAGPGFYSGAPCLTSKGEVGRCTTFRECYPYFKVPDLTAFDGWILGVYETCNYVDPDGRMAFGVCCSNPPVIPIIPPDAGNVPVVEETQVGSADSEKEKPHPPIASWPPPIPTHPPDHTIPPLPTHPPSPGFPAVTTPRPPITTTKRPGATTWPTKRPSWWPTTPVAPVKPPSSPATVAPTPGGGGVQAYCGSKNGNQDQERIVGGHSADVGEWPWIAALFNMNRQFCGGSLIDESHILSAAHCVAQMSSWDVAGLTVRLGDHNIKTNNEVRHVERRVRRIVRHRGFDSRTLYNDVAILTLDKPVAFTEQIRPVCLPSGSQLYSGKTATVIGWGSLRESGPQPAVLQEVAIPVWTNSECRSKYGAAAPGGIIESFLCAGKAAMDSCSGDSGGPLMINDGRWTQVGIVSWGIGCGKGQYPGVYTRVTHFLPWIQKNLK